MTLKIKRAAVLGAGVMGAQIAAHLAAAGVQTYLLDLPSSEPPADKLQAKLVGKQFRSARAVLAIENLKVLKPSPLFTAAVLGNIVPGNFDDDLAKLAECDWVLEAVVERLDIKQALHAKIAKHVRPGVPVTTNTSGITLAEIVQELPETYQQHFFGTHFFNPPRYMKLLEIIPHAKTDAKLQAAFENWAQERLGKGIVHAEDTVNFIANRLGALASQSAMRAMEELGLNVETVDALTGPLLGRAKSATLRTADVVGLDTGAAVAMNTYNRAPKDPYRDWFLPPKWLAELIEKGALGQKTNGVGIYKKDRDAKGNTVILAYRPASKTYEPQVVQTFPWDEAAAREKDTVKRIKHILSHDDKGAQFIWRNLRDIFAYASYLLTDIAGGHVKPVDDAVRFGFNWQMGPFELWQALGYDEIFARMQNDNVPLAPWLKPGLQFYGPFTQLQASKNGSTKATELKRPAHHFDLPQRENTSDSRVVASNPSASVLDIGDGVACLVFHSKMNTINAETTAMIKQGLSLTAAQFDALVIANDAANFSAGADIRDFLKAIQAKDWAQIDRMETEFQGLMQQLKFAPFPIVSCPVGMTFGGGSEISLQTTLRVASGETYAGLVEAGVGLFPGGGGTKELALRAYQYASYGEKADPMPFLQRAFNVIGMAKTSSSAHEAIEMGLFPPVTTQIVLSRDHVLARAKQAALALVPGFIAKVPVTGIRAAGDTGIQTFKTGLYNMVEGRMISAYDAFIGEKIATVLCGGEVDAGTLVSEQTLLDLERRLFVELCQQPKTLARIEHMLAHGKPLRN